MSGDGYWFCGEQLAFRPSGSSRIVVVCVESPGHDPDTAHRSGTDPVVRWRVNRRNPNVTDVWTEQWRDWAGRTVAERQAELPT